MNVKTSCLFRSAPSRILPNRYVFPVPGPATTSLCRASDPTIASTAVRASPSKPSCSKCSRLTICPAILTTLVSCYEPDTPPPTLIAICRHRHREQSTRSEVQGSMIRGSTSLEARAFLTASRDFTQAFQADGHNLPGIGLIDGGRHRPP